MLFFYVLDFFAIFKRADFGALHSNMLICSLNKRCHSGTVAAKAPDVSPRWVAPPCWEAPVGGLMEGAYQVFIGLRLPRLESSRNPALKPDCIRKP